MALVVDEYWGQDLRRRVAVASLLIAAALLLLASRLWYLQIVKGDHCRYLSENNRVRVRPLTAPRGMIFDRHERILVDNRPSFDLSVIPEDLKDPEETLQRLAEILELDAEELRAALEAAQDSPRFLPVKLRRDLSEEELAKVEAEKLFLPGVIIEVEPRRAYVHGDLSAQVFGYTGEIDRAQLKADQTSTYRMGSAIGKFGLEQQWESALRGEDGGRQVEVSATGREISVLRDVEPVPGHNLYLTLDLDLQKVAEEALGDNHGAVVALDPRTGEVLVMASRPAYDPNVFARGITREEWRELVEDAYHPLENRAIQSQYPPGSTFKIAVAAAAMEEGLGTRDTRVNCTGGLWFGNRYFRDWKKEGHGVVNFRSAIVQSCDVFFYTLGSRVGIDRIAQYAAALGLGRPTGIGLSNEKPGLIPSSSWKQRRFRQPWFPGETLSVSIGQGAALVTPIQLANMAAAVANGGILYVPQLVRRVQSVEGDLIEETRPAIGARVPISEETLRFLRDAMVGVVNDPQGTAKRARVDGVLVGGKTGTAQVVGMKDRETSKTLPFELRDHAWFMAFAPEDGAEIAVAALVEHVGGGGANAAPVAQKVLEAYFRKTRP
ncbi:MAG: penicillin-binding protein 2 [Deltaproteobacteria bacterium]|nr:penicillin-binding protein 2 [Deltaproteobacteria bacterium]